MSKSDLEATFDFYWNMLGDGRVFEPEFRFTPKRKWKFDRAFPALKVAVEIEGGIYTRGRHTRPSGFMKDCEKYNEAALQDWLVLRIPGPWLQDDPQKVVDQVIRALALRNGETKRGRQMPPQ